MAARRSDSLLLFTDQEDTSVRAIDELGQVTTISSLAVHTPIANDQCFLLVTRIVYTW